MSVGEVRLATNVRNDLQNTCTVLLQAGIAAVMGTWVVRTSGGQSRVEWSSAQQLTGAKVLRRPFGHCGQYLEMMRNRVFGVLFKDGGMAQCSYAFDQSGLCAHRLVYWPFPTSSLDLIISEDIGEALDAALDLLSGSMLVDSLILRGPIRFDYNRMLSDQRHPSSHVTMINQDCRIEVSRPVTPRTFLSFVVRHFYCDESPTDVVGGPERDTYWGAHTAWNPKPSRLLKKARRW